MAKTAALLTSYRKDHRTGVSHATKYSGPVQLRATNANWHRFSCQVGAKHKSSDEKIVNQISEFASQTSPNTSPQTSENTKFQEDSRFDELFAGTEP
jgi:hypothetical protein